MAGVDGQDRAGDAGSGRRGQEGDGIGDLAWLDQAPERRLCFQGIFMQRSVVNAAGKGWCRGESGADTIHSDTARAPFSCEGFCQVNNRGFCRSLGMQGRRAQARDRRDQNDRSPSL